jgi:hypothetical protein
MFYQKKIGFLMKNIYCIIVAGCLAAIASSCAMERTTIEFEKLEGICAGAFVNNDTRIMGGKMLFVKELESWESEYSGSESEETEWRQGTFLENYKTEIAKKIFDNQYNQFSISSNGIIAAFNDRLFMTYDTKSDKRYECPAEFGHRALAFGNDDRLFMHTKGHFITMGSDFNPDSIQALQAQRVLQLNKRCITSSIINPILKDIIKQHVRNKNSEPVSVGGEIIYDGKTLEEFNCRTGEWKKHAVECDSKSSVPAMTFRPVHNEIVYASGDKTLSGITIDENGNVEEKWSAIFDSVKNNLIAGQMTCNADGSCVAFCNTTGEPRGGTVFHIYDFVRKITHECGHCNGAAFYLNNPLIIALLRPNTVIEYWNIMIEKPIHYTDPIIANHELPGNCSFTMEFSPDGDNLFVVLLAGKPDSEAQDIAFLIPVPACVAAYKKMQEARK